MIAEVLKGMKSIFNFYLTVLGLALVGELTRFLDLVFGYAPEPLVLLEWTVRPGYVSAIYGLLSVWDHGSPS